MKRWWNNLYLSDAALVIAIVLAIMAAVGIGVFAIPALLWASWNAFAVPAFGAHPITFWMAVGAVVLCVVFGGLVRAVFGRRS